MRGRNNNNNNNRKGPNPLTRSYESNGPDVKIRGSAQQIAEKYGALARDAMSSGDRVMAENYLQHAEHYNRIIAAAQAQLAVQTAQSRDEYDDEMDDEGGEFDRAPLEAQAAPAAGAGPQPVIEGVPAEVALNGENGQGESNGRRENFRGRDRRDRGRRNGEEQRHERNGHDAQAPETGEAENAASADELPAFLTAEPPVVAQPEAEAPRRVRRPRRTTRSDEGEAAPIVEPEKAPEAAIASED